MDIKTASRIWVELNSGKKPKELKGVALDTHGQVWEQMQKVSLFASSKEVNRLWNKSQGITDSNILFKFGKP